MKSKDTLREEIVKTVAESLESFGFQYAIRNCRTPKYGDDAFTEERWSAETLAAFISDDILKLVEAEARQLGLEELEPIRQKVFEYNLSSNPHDYIQNMFQLGNDLVDRIAELTAPEQTEKTTGGGANE